MSALPSMPFFVDDYEAATVHLSFEEDGAYTRLLRLCWRSPGCSVPDDPDWLSRRLRCDRETFERLIRPIIDEFFTRSRGRIFQKRLRAEFGYVKRLTQNRKEAGKSGGDAKARKYNRKHPSKASVLPEQNPSKTLAPTLTPTLTPNNKQNAREFADDFDRWWKGYPHKVGKDAAKAAFVKRRKAGIDLQTMLDGVARYVAAKPPDRSWCNPATWLNQARWEDQPADAKTSNGIVDWRLVEIRKRADALYVADRSDEGRELLDLADRDLDAAYHRATA